MSAHCKDKKNSSRGAAVKSQRNCMVSHGLVQIDENESRAYSHVPDVSKLGFMGNGRKKKKRTKCVQRVFCNAEKESVLSGAQ